MGPMCCAASPPSAHVCTPKGPAHTPCRWRVELTAPLLQEEHGGGGGDRQAGTPLRSRGTSAAPTPVRSRSPVPGSAARLASMPEDEQLPLPTPDKGATAGPIAAGRPPLALGHAGSLPHDVEAAANLSAAGAEAAEWVPPGATATRFASLPDIHSEARLREQELPPPPQQQQQQNAAYWASRQIRCANRVCSMLAWEGKCWLTSHPGVKPGVQAGS